MSAHSEVVPHRRGRRSKPGEFSVFLVPLASLCSIAWRRSHYILAALITVYAISGTTFIAANQAGIVLRFGAITRSAGEPVVHPPGILFALPQPFDEVITVDVARINTIAINDLARGKELLDSVSRQPNTLEQGQIDGRDGGYILTGDRNILQSQIIVRFQIHDPIRYHLLSTRQIESLRFAVLASTLRIGGATRLDDLLTGGRDLFSAAVADDAQSRLDRIEAGIEIVSVEYEDLSPPSRVTDSFEAVQSAFIEAETTVRDARTYAATVVPQAHATASDMIDRSRALAQSKRSSARAALALFTSRRAAYAKRPEMVAQQMYRESIKQALQSVTQLHFVPSPLPSGYDGTRFSITLPNGGDQAPRDRPQAAPESDTGPTMLGSQLSSSETAALAGVAQ